MSLPDDIARCRGVGDDADGWREDCVNCLRRTTPPTGHDQCWMEPYPLLVFCCPWYMEPAV